MATALVLSEEDRIFQNRVHGAIQTVQAWEQDPELFRRCRDFLIPWDALRDDEGRYSEADDHARFQNANVVFVQRLARFFKSFMTWVNNPQCCQCGSTETVHKETRGPNSDEERKGGANRVEVYTCPTCSSSETVFPRYNSVRKLLETRQGRCGEYANLFGLFCRATGLETRYILDFTDHVWTEVYLLEQWIMVDSCEGVIDEPSMYESGWGKELNYVLAISVDHVADVTPRYTRNWSDADFQARRRAVTTSEAVSQSILQRLQENLQHNFSRKVREEMARRLKHEDHVLRRDQEKTSWKQRYRHGRLSGSLVWKAARQEVGSNDNHSQNSDEVLHQRFRVEAFYPRSANPSIIVDPKPSIQFGGVVVTGCACAIGGTKALSIVVIDEKHRGCILQSRSFPTLSALGSFVDTIPKHRIVVVRGHIDVAGELTNATVKAQLSRLGGFKAATVTAGCMYIGQVEVKPNWAVCKSFDEASYGIRLNLSTSDEYVYCKDNIRLQKEENTRPLCIEGRLPESFLPLQAQLLASDEQKRAEFLRYISEYSDHFCSGFCTKQRAPIYLLGPSSYPFEQVNDIEASDVWNSFLLLPSALVALDDTSVSKQSSIPLFEVPVDTEFFVRSLGQQLLSKTGSSQTLINTSEALSNKRLLALYFSGSWCAPCRQFTPVLAELYSYLAEKFPSHGLEIVSSALTVIQMTSITTFAACRG